ncbi:MAG: hypothetical protein H7235_05450 [Bdellovibrionaceae bacterium]|nr:hypothetical protein [Pseudobdellovibrionaceae bacterium]
MKNNLRNLLIFLISCTMLHACMKKQDLESQDLGPAISSDELQNKMSDSIGKLNYADINKNEISTFTATTVFEETQVNKRFKQDLFVTNVVGTSAKLTIDFLFNKQDFANSESSLSNQPYQMVIEASNTTAQSLAKAADIPRAIAKNVHAQAETHVPFFLYRAYAYFALQGCRENKVTCHNLKTETSKMYLKPALASPTVCPDTSNCLVDIKKVEFDMLDSAVATSDGKPYRTHYTFSVSPQLPFLSKVMSYCVRGLMDNGNRKVLAEDCMSINNFSYGQQP